MEKIQPISFRKVIAPLESNYLEYEVPDSGTIENVRAYFAQGQQFDLLCWPVIIQAGTEVGTDIITAAPGTDKWLYGDNVLLPFPCTQPVDPHDKIRVYYKSLDAANPMNLNVDVTIDYYGGNARLS